MNHESTLSFAGFNAQSFPSHRQQASFRQASSKKKVDVSVSPRSFREKVRESSRDMYSDKQEKSDVWHNRFTRLEQMKQALVNSSKSRKTSQDSLNKEKPHPSFTAVQSYRGTGVQSSTRGNPKTEDDSLLNKSA
jgi:hypothetical protein